MRRTRSRSVGSAPSPDATTTGCSPAIEKTPRNAERIQGKTILNGGGEGGISDGSTPSLVALASRGLGANPRAWPRPPARSSPVISFWVSEPSTQESCGGEGGISDVWTPSLVALASRGLGANPRAWPRPPARSSPVISFWVSEPSTQESCGGEGGISDVWTPSLVALASRGLGANPRAWPRTAGGSCRVSVLWSVEPVSQK